MKSSKRFYAFKIKLSVLLFTVVILVSSFLGLFQYAIMKKSLEKSFEQSKKLIKDRVISTVKDTDYINLLKERPLESEARELLYFLKRKYEMEGTVNFDLAPILQGSENMHLYVIDTNNSVIAATDIKDVGLNFNKWPDFIKYLDSIRKAGEFSADRVSFSVNGLDAMKYCYLPSSDGKYIFESGTILKNEDTLNNRTGFDNFQEEIIEDNRYVDSVMLFSSGGESYKKNDMGERVTVSPEHMECFLKAIQAMETVEATVSSGGKKIYYQYVPYKIIDAKGTNDRNVIEIIYNDSVLQENLEQNVKIILVVVLMGAVLAASYGFFRARRITKPIEVITEGVKQVAKGNFDFSVIVDSNDEMALLAGQFSSMTKEIKNLLEEKYQLVKDLENKNQENKRSYFETVRALAKAVEEKDSYTGGHCERVMEYSMIIAEEMGLSLEDINHLKFGSILHDIGKIGIGESILNKDGILSEEEYDQVKKHPEIGNRILEDFHFLEKCRKIIFEHHERVDGKGYPNGLKGDEIDLFARIVCVADAYDAMTSSRPYRKKAMTQEMAVRELLANRGKQFDEKVVDAFVGHLIRY